MDLWAIGIILYEFLLGIPPFNAPTAHQIFRTFVIVIYTGLITTKKIPAQVKQPRSAKAKKEMRKKRIPYFPRYVILSTNS